MDDIHVTDTTLWSTRQRLKSHTSTARMIAWSSDGETLVSCGHDRRLCIWSPSDGRLRHELQGHRSIIRWVTISPDGRTILSSDQSGNVNLWHLATGELIGQLWSDEQIPLRSLGFSKQMRLVALSHGNKLVTFDFSD